jgi:hypothetical protein
MSAAPGGPVTTMQLLQLRRLHSFLTVDFVTWPNGRFGVSVGYEPISDRNPLGKRRFVTIEPREIPAVIHALEEAGARIAAELQEDA